MEFNFSNPVNAFGYDFIERTASIPGYEMAFTDSTFVISIYDDVTKLAEYTFTPANNVASFFGVSSAQEFNKVIVEETVGTVDDELYGKLYFKSTPDMICPSGQMKTVKPESPLCMLTVVPKIGGSNLSLIGYDHTVGNCTLAATTTHDVPGKTISPLSGSTGLTVSSDIEYVAATTSSTFVVPSQVTPLFTCPTNTVAHCLAVTPSGSFSCGCYSTGVNLPTTIAAPEYTCEIVGCGE